MSARTRELLGLLPVSLLVTAGFTAVLVARSDKGINNATLTYGAIFLGACVLGHVFIRARLPYADPFIYPLVALLAGVGMIEIYRIDPNLAWKQATLFGVGLLLFVGTILFLRDYRSLERYRYTIAIAGIVLLLAPRLPGIGQATNGAYLSIGVGSFAFQPAEFAKIAIVIFLASYLNDVRDVLVRGRVPKISLKHLGPLLVIWGLAMLMLVFIRDLGSSVMFFGAFLALLYVATNRLSLVLPGLALFLGGATFLANHVPHVHERVQAWLHPFKPALYDKVGGSYQIAQSLFAQADGGLFGRGFGQALLTQVGPAGKPVPIVPAAQTDLIYAVVVNELGLFGGAAILAIGLLFVARGFKTATLATDGFAKLLATGLTAVFAIQIFVIVGGVTKVIPLTGVTLPFVSYGGSSIVANFVLVALLLIVSDRARRDPLADRGGVVLNRQISILFGVIIVLFAVLAAFTSRWTVFQADSLKSEAFNKRPLLEQQQIPRGQILARDGTKLAVNRSQGVRQSKRYYRVYPQPDLFPHAVGYSFVSAGDSGLEKSYNDVLGGTADKQLSSFIDQLGGGPKEGDDLKTNLDPAAQKEALAALGGQDGAVVAMEPSTGRVRVMANVPAFDPNKVPEQLAELNKGHGGSLLSRATQAQYPPGSTMKVVTSAAALDTGKYKPDSFVNGKDNVVISGVPLHNYGNESFGAISLTDALTNSVNTVYGQIGEKLGKATMLRYMKRFGFQSQPPIDLPSQQVAASGVLKPPQPLSADDNWDVGRVAIGQEPHLFVTPLQMAMVASAVGNKGRLMEPHLADKVVEPDGRVRETIRPQEQSTVMSESAASDLAGMMTNVVKSGTGTGGALQGIQVAGKTGTADNPRGGNYAWFIAFAPVKDPKVAIAVVIEHTTQSQTGGEVAAPIAARVMRVLLRENG